MENNSETTKELRVLDEMGKEVRKLTKFEQTIEQLKEVVAHSQEHIQNINLEDPIALQFVKAKRLEIRKIEIAIEKRGKGYRDVFNAVNKEIIGKEKELKAVTSPEIERLAEIEEQAEVLALKKKREALMPARKERLLEVDPSGCYICADEYLLDMDADAFEKYLNGCVANKNERNRILVEEEAAKRREEEQKRLAEERAQLEREKEEERQRKEKEAEEKRKEEEAAKEKEIERRRGLLPERKAELEKIGDKVPTPTDDVLLAMDDTQYSTYYNNRVAAKNEADAKAIEDAKKAEEERKAEEARKAEEERVAKEKREADEKAEAERVAKEEAERKAEMEKREAYKKFLKEHGWTPETRDQFETREVEGGYELWKKVGVFNK